MIYGSEPLKPVPPQKICVGPAIGYNGPQAYTYSYLAKQPGSNYKIRLRDIERVREVNFKLKNEEDNKNLNSQIQHIKMFMRLDKKIVCNKIKKMVESELKANEHLFLENRPKPESKVEIEIEPPKVSNAELLEKAEELKKKRDEEERKIVEKKRLQLFIDNSEELRIAAIEKRKREIGVMNYLIIQEKERNINEQKINNRLQANLENAEIFKNQALEREEEKRKIQEKKHQFRQELHEQLMDQEAIRKHAKELKIIECNYYEKLKETFKKEEEDEKLDRINKQEQKRNEIEQFTKKRSKLFSESLNAVKTFNERLALTMSQNIKDDMADKIATKIRLKYENEEFKKQQAIIKEELRQQNEAIINKVLQQIREIEELKRSVERKNDEVRRKRAEDGNRALMEQIKLHAIVLEEQKAIQRKMFEEAQKEFKEYLEENKQLCKHKNKIKRELRIGLNEQMEYNKKLIEHQRKMDMEIHQTCLMEIDEHEQLLKKLLNELYTNSLMQKC